MNARERVLKAINLQEPDRIPLDIGGAYACGINIKAYKRLVEYLGIDLPEIKLSKLTNQTAHVDEEVLKKNRR